MTMHEDWTDRLSDYLDGELSDAEQRAVAAHIADCDSCARTLEELRHVVTVARTAAPVDPPADLWSQISARIESTEGARPVVLTGPWRRFSFTLPQMAAASLLLAVLSGWAAMRLFAPTAQPAVASNTAGAGTETTVGARSDAGSDVARAAVSFDDTEYDAAVADLERALQNGRGRLDPTTVKVVEDNLTIIDQAVDEARRALAEDPANGYLSGYLVETRRRKLDLLRQATALTEDAN